MVSTYQQLKYPEEQHEHDVAIQGARGPWTRMMVIRPLSDGRFSLFIYPHGFMTRPFLQRWDLLFEDRDGPPARLEFSPPKRMQIYQRWFWSVYSWPDAVNPMPVKAGKNRTPLIVEIPEDCPMLRDADLLFGSPPVLNGELNFEREANPAKNRRFVVWSCHQPYETEAGKPIVASHVENVLTWYRRQMEDFKPNEIWGLGDTMYADGKVDLTSQLDDLLDWWKSKNNLARLRIAYANSYRYHWSFPNFQKVTRNYPHITMWDDHEIRDGWGSEETDFTDSGIAMLGQARLAAEDYILDLGPRVHPRNPTNEAIKDTSLDTHCAYIDGELAVFIFDGRSSRRYRDCSGLVISDAQMKDFAAFCAQICVNKQVKSLLLGIGTTIVNLADVVEEIGSVLPDWINKEAEETRDDVRDGMNSPGNRAQLRQLCGIWLWLHRLRPDLEFVVLSGDIHLSNAFTFQPPGFAKPVYQISTSALTNRQCAPKLLTTIGGQDNDWSTLTDILSYVIPAPCAKQFSIEGVVKGAIVGSMIGTGVSILSGPLAIYGAWRLLNLDFSSGGLGILGAIGTALTGPLIPVLGSIIGGTSIGSQRNDNPVQSVIRLWDEERNPNILMIHQTYTGLVCNLKVYDLDDKTLPTDRPLAGSLDKTIRVGIDTS